VLILPSSRSEVRGHPEWDLDWPDYPDAFDEVLATIQAHPSDCVLRCHPGWAERIGRFSALSADMHYASWARRRGMHVISSGERVRTTDLIQQSDVVLVGGSTAAVEAGFLGKSVICVGPSMYQSAGLGVHIATRAQLCDADTVGDCVGRDMIRRTLRYVYSEGYRCPQYVNFVRATDAFRYLYFSGGDGNRLTEMLRTGVLAPDDTFEASDLTGEDEVLECIAEQNWEQLAHIEKCSDRPPEMINRTLWLRWIDRFREAFPVGDR
jgi:hypothetical protein